MAWQGVFKPSLNWMGLNRLEEVLKSSDCGTCDRISGVLLGIGGRAKHVHGVPVYSKDILSLTKEHSKPYLNYVTRDYLEAI